MKRRGHPRMPITDIHSFSDVACDMIYDFLESFKGNLSLLRPIDPENDDAELVDLGCPTIYTQRGMQLYDSYCRRISQLAENAYPDTVDELHINVSNMIEP